MFKKVKISELGEIISGGTPKTKVDEYWNGCIPWITPKDLSNYESMYISQGERSITKLGLEKSSARLLPKGTILFTSRAPIGYVAIANSELATNQGFKNIIVNNQNYNVFIYYLLKYNKEFIENYANGSTFKELSAITMKNLELAVPSLGQQKSIANILSTLDKKIELNNQINKTLESMAQEIFKHWFIDFEFLNEDGKSYKSSGGEMVESEMGMIPKGWKVGTLSNMGDIVGGATPSKKNEEFYTSNGIPWITPKDLSNIKNLFISRGEVDISLAGFNKSSTKKMPKGTVLFSSRAPIGYIAITKNEVTTNQGFKSVVPNRVNGFSSEFIYFYLKENLSVIENNASGSTFKEISGAAMKKIKAIIPNKRALSMYENITHNIFKDIEVKESENFILKDIRDSLLPKLMSGEIRVPIDN